MQSPPQCAKPACGQTLLSVPENWSSTHRMSFRGVKPNKGRWGVMARKAIRRSRSDCDGRTVGALSADYVSFD